MELERLSVEEEEVILGKKDCLEKLNHGDGDEPRTKSFQLNLDKEIDLDDIMIEDDRVADFASSMLAAISCWHYRARALLSMEVTTVRLSASIGFPSHCIHLASGLT